MSSPKKYFFMNGSQYSARTGTNSFFCWKTGTNLPVKNINYPLFYLDEQAVWFVPRVHGWPWGPAALRLQPPEAQPLRRGEQLPQQDAHVRVPHAGKICCSREGWPLLSAYCWMKLCHMGTRVVHIKAVLWAGFRIRIHFLRIRIRIQRIRMEANTDPGPDPIRIQGFNDQKLKKNNSWKKN